MCLMLGYSREELVRMTWTNITHPDDIEASLVSFNQVLSGEIDEYSLVKRYIRKDGEIIFVELSAGCVRNQDGSVKYFLSLFYDITERVRTEEELRGYRQHLEELVTLRTAELAKTNEELKAVNQELEDRK